MNVINKGKNGNVINEKKILYFHMQLVWRGRKTGKVLITDFIRTDECIKI